MIKILANDGLAEAGIKALQAAGFDLDLMRIPQEELEAKLPAYDVILVRSATKVRKELIDACPNLKVIGRGGVGLDNIDVDYAQSKGIKVINTPAASSQSVAELVLGHMLSLARSLHLSNRAMPQVGNTEFKALKKSYSKGLELRGKTLGVIGFGRIGQSAAAMGLGAGMHLLAHDPYVKNADLKLPISGHPDGSVTIKVQTVSMEEVLSKSDFITIHVPSIGKYLIDKAEFDQMKTGAFFINCARGGTSSEAALLEALNSGKLAGAALDVFETEPSPDVRILKHPKISLTPHTGASTFEAQQNIGTELATQLIDIFK